MCVCVCCQQGEASESDQEESSVLSFLQEGISEQQLGENSAVFGLSKVYLHS